MCCGSQRAAARAAAIAAAPRHSSRSATPAPTPLAAPARAATTVFEYTGDDPMEIRGPGSGRSYRFASAGHRIAVDPRDWPALAAMAVLRRVR